MGIGDFRESVPFFHCEQPSGVGCGGEGGAFLPAEPWHQRVSWLLIERKQHKKPPSTSLLTHPSSPKAVSILPPVETLSPPSKPG